MNEDWDLLVSFLPAKWAELAGETGALKGLRKDKSADSLLRTLLVHLGCGYSLRETVVRARKAHLSDLSDVALLNWLRKSQAWLHALCAELFREQSVAVSAAGGFQMRAFDATTVKEPGTTGSLGRLHYSVSLPSLFAGVRLLQTHRHAGVGHGRVVPAVSHPGGGLHSRRRGLLDRGRHSARGGPRRLRHGADQ